MVDRINPLPDDILISIISRLTLREAIATGILSTFWRHLFSYSTRLRFPRFKLKYNRLQDVSENKFSNQIQMINHMVDTHNVGWVLKEFRVHMPCFTGANIEKWFQFALEREVETIDIEIDRRYNPSKVHYTPLQALIMKNSCQSLTGLKSLKELSLEGVDIDDRDIELLISDCVNLEHLTVIRKWPKETEALGFNFLLVY